MANGCTFKLTNLWANNSNSFESGSKLGPTSLLKNSGNVYIE